MKSLRKFGPVALLVAATALSLVLTAPLMPLAASDKLFEAFVLRLFGQTSPPNERIVIVGITEDTLSLLPYRSPIDRKFLAELIELLLQRGVRVIGLDIVFDRPTEPDKDRLLQDVLDRAKQQVVLAAVGSQTALDEDNRLYHNDFLRGRLHGAVNLPRGMLDSTIRRYLVEVDGKPSFGVALAHAAGTPLPDKDFRIVYRRPDAGGWYFPTYPAHLMAVLPEPWLKDKIVLIGSLVPGLDEHQTPASMLSRPLFGSEVHAHALAQILDQRTSPIAFPTWLVAMFTAALGYVLAKRLSSAVALAVAIVVIIALVWLAAGISVVTAGTPLLPVAPTLALAISAGGIRIQQARQERRERQQLTTLFSKFVSGPVLDELWRERDNFITDHRPRPHRLTATVLFSDIVGFTPICEKLPPDTLIAWLDRYIDTMVQIVSDHNGIVLRFIGDGILAVFGAPVARTSEAEIDLDAQNSVRCALMMVHKMRTLNDEWRRQELPTAAIRVGIYTGEMVAGSLGSGLHMEYCVQGDTVNTAARLEALGKASVKHAEDCVILVGEPTYMRLKEVDAEKVGTVRLKGKEKPAIVYRIKC